MGLIYFYQPPHLIGLNRYKISCTNSCDYFSLPLRKTSRYISIADVNEPLILKNIIIKEFNNKFKLIAGDNFFMGDEDEMNLLFLQLINEYKKNK